MNVSYPLLRLEMQRGEDCALACLASLTGYRYEDVLAEASRKEPVGSFPHETGLYLSQIICVAKRLGCRLKRKQVCNFEKDEGILSVAWNKKKHSSHVVVVVRGLIFDLCDMTIWDPEDYLKFHKARFGSILVPV